MEKSILRHLSTIALLLAWLCLFFYCAHTPSKPTIEMLTQTEGLERAVLLLETIVTWAWTNLFFLCVIAASAGEIAREGESRPALAMIRGFFIFLAAISGQVLFMGSVQFHLNSQEDYFRIAGSLSLLSFLVGYNPRFFSKIILRMESSTQIPRQGESTHEKENPRPIPQEEPTPNLLDLQPSPSQTRS